MSTFIYSKRSGVRKLKEEYTFQSWFEKSKDKFPDAIECDPPTEEQMQDWLHDSICETPCGCSVEPDGYCRHGRPSWLIILGLI